MDKRRETQDVDKPLEETQKVREGYSMEKSIQRNVGVREVDFKEDSGSLVTRHPQKREAKENFTERSGTTIEAFLASSAETRADPSSAIYQDDRGVVRVDVIAEDPVTKRPINLQGIRLSQFHANEIQRVTPNSRVLVTVLDVRDIRERNTGTMSARIVTDDFRSTNTAIPDKILRKNRRGKVSSDRRRVCSVGTDFDFDTESSTLFNKQSLSVMSDTTNSRSPGLAVDSSSHSMHFFHKDGNGTRLDQEGYHVNAPKTNIGKSKIQREAILSGGLPAGENPLSRVYPSSNILLNVPAIAPPWLVEVGAVMVGINIIYKLWRVGKVCEKAIREG